MARRLAPLAALAICCGSPGPDRAVDGAPSADDASLADGRGSTEVAPYPLVLVHGAFGTDSYFGILDYFYRVRDTLRAAGFPTYTPATQPVGESEVRAVLLGASIDEILADTGATKVHLIGHSQGGLDIRVLVSSLGFADRVASMTTIATPHHGLRVAIPELFSGMDFSESYMTEEFASAYPDNVSIPRFSWAGKTCVAVDLACVLETGGELVTPFFSVWHGLVRAAYADDLYGGANDGVVAISSAIWGDFLGILPADHYDEIGQVADNLEGPFRHLEFYLSEAHRLRQLEIQAGL